MTTSSAELRARALPTADAAYERAVQAITTAVALLNVTLGIAAAAKHRVTFGYIGNCDLPRYDDRIHKVFLPHPGRYGTAADTIGGFRTGDLDGARACLAAVNAASRMALWTTENMAVVTRENARHAAGIRVCWRDSTTVTADERGGAICPTCRTVL